METRKIELGDVFYVFSNWGLAKGHVVKIEKSLLNNKENKVLDIDTGSETFDPEWPTDDDGNDIETFELCQYKLNIDDYCNEGTNYDMKYGFFYCEDQLFNTPCEAIQSIVDTWKCNAK